MKQPPLIASIALAIIVHGNAVCGSAQELGDPGFEALNGKTVSREVTAGQWSIPAGAPYADGIEVKADPAAAHSGKVGLNLQELSSCRLAVIHQPIPQLTAGIYEFKVWAKGKGALVLKTDTLRRRGDLTKDWVDYSLTFEQAKAGPADIAILVNGTAQADDASLAPASPEKQAAWKEQERARAEYGFVPEYFSAQSPQPGAPVKPAGTFQGGPVTWREKVIFFDKRYDIINSQDPEPLARYLGANGFQVLEAAPFGEWMKKATHEGAYGTVCVLANGIWPGSVYDSKMKESPLRKYMEAGGRVVWVGDTVLYYMEDDVHPQMFTLAIDKNPLEEVLGVRSGWEQACWGDKGEPKITALGKAWGLALPGGTTFASYPEDVTATLSHFYSDKAASLLAVNWFKNLNPLNPWSGFVSHRAEVGSPAFQESVYRLALYSGKPVEAPVGIPALAKLETAPLKVSLDSPRNRQNYYRGEKIPVRLEVGTAVFEGSLHLTLVRNGETFPAGEYPPPTKETPSQVTIPTANLACGDYQLKILGTNTGKEHTVYETTISLCPRHEDPTFLFGTGGSASNPYRQELILKYLSSAGMNTLGKAIFDDTPTSVLDSAIQYDLHFGVRAHGPVPRGSTDPEWAEALARGPNGETIPSWTNGQPSLGLLSAKRRQIDAEDIARQVKGLSGWPNFLPQGQTGDDFGMDYGWDYSDLAKRMFKEKTGLEAPVPPEIANLKAQFRSCSLIDGPKGVVPDNDPWLQWTIFATKDIVGGYNKALTEACVKAVPGFKLGPVPGSMMLPLWEWGQYPPHSFGAGGFNLLSYYCYNNYWQPEIAYLYWDEIARLNNRGLELETLGDCSSQNEPTYMRNAFFLHLAGGCQTIHYFTSWDKSASLKELGRLGNAVVKPLYPFLGKLRPVQTENGLLLPYTQFAHMPLYPGTAIYAYANLLGTHLDIQPTCEEEAISGYIKNYKTILLWHVEWMRESVVKALEDYIAKGGVVLADSTTVVPIKGAIKLPVDFAMGEGKSDPGIRDYLHPDRVADIAKAIAPYAKPWADCADSTLITRRQTYNGVTYLWLVNIHSGEEYEYIRPRTFGLSESLQLANPEKAKKELDQYLAERADQRFTPRVTIPAGNWAAYDVLKGQRVQLDKEGNRLAFTADMERLGGTLIALYPEPVARVTATVATSAVKRKSWFSRWFGFGGVRISRGQSATLNVTVSGPSGQPLAGTQPLAVTVTTPQGKWAEITGAHATEDGVWSTTIHPAINDPSGTWKVRVKELSSGIAGETVFTVK